jgi:hypothetical protein
LVQRGGHGKTSQRVLDIVMIEEAPGIRVERREA